MRITMTLLLAMFVAGVSMLLVSSCQGQAIPAPVHTSVTHAFTQLGSGED